MPNPKNYAISILSYNHPELTAKTIQSVLETDFSVEKIFLIHNGSELVHQNALVSQFPQIHHLILDKNKGYSGGANFAFAEVFKLHSNIFFLTNDTEVLELPDEFPSEYDFFSVSILKRNSASMDSVMGAINLKNGKLSHLKSRADIQVTIGDLKSETYIPGTAYGITKKTYVTLAGFDESLHTYWEDVDFSLRAHRASPRLKVGYSDQFKVKHKIGKTCHKHRFYTLYLFQRNRRRIMHKFGLSTVTFYFHFVIDMTRLFFKIFKSKNFKTDIHFWWRALCE